MVGFHPISTARKVLVWSKTTISALIEYTIVLTFTILFSIISRIKHLRPSTRDRLSAVINPQRSRRPIFPSFPASSSSSSTREAANLKPIALSSSPLPALTAPEPDSPLPDHQFLALTADDNFSDTAVGSVIDHDSSSYPFPSPTKLSSEYKIKEAEHAAKLITARAQRLADGMLTSAAALHDTWVQDAHRQYHAIIAKARSETEPLAAQLEQLRKRVEECEDKGIQTDDIIHQTEEQQQQKQTTLRFSTVQFVDNPPSSSTPSSSILNEKNDIELPPLPQLPAAAVRPVTPVKQIITPPSPQSAATPSPSTRPSTGARPSTSYSESLNTSPIRLRKLSKRPKSMDMMGMSPLASLSPAESAANTAMKRNSSSTSGVGLTGGGGSKRGAVRGFMEKTSNRLFSGNGPFGGSGEKEGGGVLVNVARSTSGKKGKKEKK